MALPTTFPDTVNVTVPLAGKVGINADTALPITVTVDGHTAPLVAPAQVAATPVKVLGTRSLKLVPPAALGPALVTTIVQLKVCRGWIDAAAILVTRISATGTMVSVTDL